MEQARHTFTYRFHDLVAFHVSDGEKTEYLSPSLAREFARKLIEVADNVEKVPFSESTITPEYQYGV